MAVVGVGRIGVLHARHVQEVARERGVHVGAFRENPLRVSVEALDQDGVIARRTFTMRDSGPGVPVFIERFGPACRAEVAHFVDRVAREEPFAVTHEDGREALRVVPAASSALRTRDDAARAS